ncbi:MAG: rhomboid family intramembrane serine protease [Blastocatellales bacterium]
MSEESILPESSETMQRGPILVWLVCAVCVIVFIGLSSGSALESWETASTWGYYPPGAEWDGRYWGLITSVFVHVELWHLAFNVYWLWYLGGRLEKAIGMVRWLAFFLMAAIVSSGLQLAVSDTTGIGASGVVYAIFGFMWWSQDHYEGFRESLTKQTVFIFIVWLVICLVATYLKIWEVGNTAHVSGLIFGIAVAEACVTRRKVILARVAGITLVVASIVTLFWCPWSAGFVSRKAYKAHSKGDYLNAIALYRRSLELGQDAVWVWTNMAMVYKQMGDEAKYEEAVRTLEKLDEKAAQSVK